MKDEEQPLIVWVKKQWMEVQPGDWISYEFGSLSTDVFVAQNMDWEDDE